MKVRFMFEIGQLVEIKRSGERGVVHAASVTRESPDQFLVRYKSAVGMATESWFQEDELTTPVACGAVGVVSGEPEDTHIQRAADKVQRAVDKAATDYLVKAGYTGYTADSLKTTVAEGEQLDRDMLATFQCELSTGFVVTVEAAVTSGENLAACGANLRKHLRTLLKS